MTTDAARFQRLADELDHLGRRLTAVGVELRAVGGAPEAAGAPASDPSASPLAQPVPGQPAHGVPRGDAAAQPPASPAAPPVVGPGPVWPGPGNMAQPGPMGEPAHPEPLPPVAAMGYAGQQAPTGHPYPYPGWPYGAYQQPEPAGHYGHPPYPRPPTLGERLGKEGAGSRWLAWVGGAVTLLGVVLLLVLAVQRGWLGPVPRVVVGAAFGGALLGAGAWLHRKPAARTGAFALAATGIAVLYLDTIAATSLYEFLPITAGLVVGLGIAVGGLLLAVKWDSSLLAGSVVVACGVCAPVITQGFTSELVTFLLILQIATTPVQLRRSWWSLSFASAIPPLTTSMIGAALHTQHVGVAVAASAVSVALSLIFLRRTENEQHLLTVLAVAPLPVLVTALTLPKGQAALLAGVTALVLVTTWPFVRGQSGTVAGIAGLVAALQATVTEFDGGTVLLGEAVALAFAARFSKNRYVLGGSLFFGALGGVLAMVSDVTPVLLVVARPHATAELLAALAAATVLLGAAIAWPWAAARLGILTPARLLPWLPAGLVALYGAAGLVLSTALLAVPGRTGFLLGHALITVSWTVAALVLLLRGIAIVALRVIGLVLVAAAIAKLVLFDLAALDGLARVGAFLGAGIVLLLAGSRYARLVASR